MESHKNQAPQQQNHIWNPHPGCNASSLKSFTTSQLSEQNFKHIYHTHHIIDSAYIPTHWHPSQLPKCLLTFFKFLSNTDFHLPKSTKLQSPSPPLQPLQLSSTQIQLSNVCQFGLLSRHSKRSAGFLWGGLWSNSATAQEISLVSRKETKQLTHANLSFKDSTLNRKYVSSLWYVLPRVTIAFVGTLVILLGNTRAISLL